MPPKKWGTQTAQQLGCPTQQVGVKEEKNKKNKNKKEMKEKKQKKKKKNGYE